MIETDSNKNSLKEIRKREKATKEAALRAKCEALAIERYGEDTIKKLSNQHKGLWYLSVEGDEEGVIEALAIMKPIDRHILSYASTKIDGEGLYAFLESAMREVMLPEYSDAVIIDDDEYFIPAANTFNKILEVKKATLLKR